MQSKIRYTESPIHYGGDGVIVSNGSRRLASPFLLPTKNSTFTTLGTVMEVGSR